MKVLFSTVIRQAPVDRGGELVRVDWETKTVERAVPILPRNSHLKDPNPRGGMRGGRGVQVFGDEVLAASYDTIKAYDLELNHLRDISHPLMVGNHETHPSGDHSLWVTMTAVDAALNVDIRSGDVIGQIWPRELPGFQQRLGLVPSDIDKTAHDQFRFLSEELTKHPSHLHFNAISSLNGETWGLFSRFGTIANIDRQEVVIEDPALMGGHNLVFVDGSVLVNHTRGHGVRVYELESRRLVREIDVSSFPFVRDLVSGVAVRPTGFKRLKRKVMRKLGRAMAPVARPLFMRGMSLVGGSLFLGTSPASILRIDWQTGQLIDAFSYATDVRVAIHGLKAIEE